MFFSPLAAVHVSGESANVTSTAAVARDGRCTAERLELPRSLFRFVHSIASLDASEFLEMLRKGVRTHSNQDKNEKFALRELK